MEQLDSIGEGTSLTYQITFDFIGNCDVKEDVLTDIFQNIGHKFPNNN